MSSEPTTKEELRAAATTTHAKPGWEAEAGRAGWSQQTLPVSKSSASLFTDYLRRGVKPAGEWRCGVEFEVFGYNLSESLERIGAVDVQAALAGLRLGSEGLVFEDGSLVEVGMVGGGRVSVEPGGQLEFSGAPRRGLADVERDLKTFLSRLGEVAAAHGLVFLAAGFDPLRALEDQRWFPKSRYKVMRPYLAVRGRRAWDMMTRTCAVQVNLDYGSDEDLAKKFLVGNRLAPVVTAIFANSPFERGRPSGYKSTRAAAWAETDAERVGISPAALAGEFSPESFVAYTLGVPMIFVQRGGLYLVVPEKVRPVVSSRLL